MRRIRLIILIAGLLLATTPVLAKGPAEKITISGPGLQGEIEITDQQTLWALPMFAPADIEFNNRQGIPAPNVGVGYEIVRYFRQGNTLRAVDMAHYYPHPSGDVGYVFYDGFVDLGMSTEFDGKWYPATPEGDAVMKQILAMYGVSTLPTTGAATTSTVWLPLVATFLLVAGLLLRRLHLLLDGT